VNNTHGFYCVKIRKLLRFVRVVGSWVCVCVCAVVVAPAALRLRRCASSPVAWQQADPLGTTQCAA